MNKQKYKDMKNIYLPIILLATILLSGCYKHDDIKSSSEEKIIAVPEDSKDPLDKFIYEFYENYSSVIYYNYVTDDYQWNMDKRNDNIYTPQKINICWMRVLSILRKCSWMLMTMSLKRTISPCYLSCSKDRCR